VAKRRWCCDAQPQQSGQIYSKIMPVFVRCGIFIFVGRSAFHRWCGGCGGHLAEFADIWGKFCGGVAVMDFLCHGLKIGLFWGWGHGFRDNWHNKGLDSWIIGRAVLGIAVTKRPYHSKIIEILGHVSSTFLEDRHRRQQVFGGGLIIMYGSVLRYCMGLCNAL